MEIQEGRHCWSWGCVGATFAFSLAQSGLADEIVLIGLPDEETMALNRSAAVLQEAHGSSPYTGSQFDKGMQ